MTRCGPPYDTGPCTQSHNRGSATGTGASVLSWAVLLPVLGSKKPKREGPWESTLEPAVAPAFDRPAPKFHRMVGHCTLHGPIELIASKVEATYRAQLQLTHSRSLLFVPGWGTSNLGVAARKGSASVFQGGVRLLHASQLGPAYITTTPHARGSRSTSINTSSANYCLGGRRRRGLPERSLGGGRSSRLGRSVLRCLRASSAPLE